MVISSDVLLKGTAWKNGISNLSNIFKTKTNYSVFVMSISIGIMYDKQIEIPVEDGAEPLYVPRNVLTQNTEELDFLFQTAILTTDTVDIDEDRRMELAFGEEKKDELDRLKFLVKFANFGIIKMVEKIGIDELDTMENIKDFLTSTMEGTNFEIDSIDEKLEEDINEIILD